MQDKYNAYKAWRLGVGIDVDGWYGNQCVDVDNDYAMYLFPGHSWQSLLGTPTAAKDLLSTANTDYFEVILNDHNDPNQLPQVGDIAVFAASPEAGYTSRYTNPDGHTGIVDHADGTYIWLLQQDGSTGQAVTQLAQRPWRYTRCIGWLRPKLGASPTPSPTPQPSGKTLFLPSSVTQWRIYSVHGPYTVGHEVGFLKPANFPPGLYYQIQATLAPNIYQIQTRDFGQVAIYAGSDTDAEIQ